MLDFKNHDIMHAFHVNCAENKWDKMHYESFVWQHRFQFQEYKLYLLKCIYFVQFTPRISYTRFMKLVSFYLFITEKESRLKKTYLNVYHSVIQQKVLFDCVRGVIIKFWEIFNKNQAIRVSCKILLSTFTLVSL